jgi:CheY-like chemotaxis protein
MQKQILVIEDDPGIADVVESILAYEGYQVKVSKNGDIIDSLINQINGTPSVILMDIYLLQSDGRELTKKLKKTNTTKHIPVVIMSASFNADKDAKLAGADDFLAKPFTLETLVSKVKRYIN